MQGTGRSAGPGAEMASRQNRLLGSTVHHSRVQPGMIPCAGPKLLTAADMVFRVGDVANSQALPGAGLVGDATTVAAPTGDHLGGIRSEGSLVARPGGGSVLLFASLVWRSSIRPEPVGETCCQCQSWYGDERDEHDGQTDSISSLHGFHPVPRTGGGIPSGGR